MLSSYIRHCATWSPIGCAVADSSAAILLLQVWLVMELCTGGSLKEACSTPHDKLDMVRQQDRESSPSAVILVLCSAAVLCPLQLPVVGFQRAMTVPVLDIRWPALVARIGLPAHLQLASRL